MLNQSQLPFHPTLLCPDDYACRQVSGGHFEL